MWGSIISFVPVTVILVGAHLSELVHPQLPFSTDNCDVSFLNGTILEVVPQQPPNLDSVHWLFKISFMYYSVISVAIFFLVAFPVSIFTSRADDKRYQEMDQRLFAPFIRDKALLRQQARQRVEQQELLTTLMPPHIGGDHIGLNGLKLTKTEASVQV